MEVRAGHVDDFSDGGRRFVEVDGRDVVVLRHQGRYYALDNTCLHMGGPVGQGMIIPKIEAILDEGQRLIGHRYSENEVHLVCPWHGYEYDIENGRQAGEPNRCLRTYETELRGEAVYVHA